MIVAKMVCPLEPRPKKTEYRIGRGRMYRDPEYAAWEEKAAWYFKSQWQGAPAIDQPVKLMARHYRDNRADLDNLNGALCDVLQKAGVLKNDRLIHEEHTFKILDKSPPRTEVEIEILPSLPKSTSRRSRRKNQTAS